MSSSVISRYPLGHRFLSSLQCFAVYPKRGVNRACRTCAVTHRESLERVRSEGSGGLMATKIERGCASGLCHWRQSSPPRSVPSRINYPGDGCTVDRGASAADSRTPLRAPSTPFALLFSSTVSPTSNRSEDWNWREHSACLGCYRIERDHRRSIRGETSSRTFACLLCWIECSLIGEDELTRR